MIFEVKDITPADYIRGEDGILRVDPQLQYRLHCHFVLSLSACAAEEGWMIRLIHSSDSMNHFPSVAMIPPGQEGKSVLTSYRVEGGILQELNAEEEKKPYVGRLFSAITTKQRAVAGPVDFHLPAILSEKRDGLYYLGGQEGAYDPADWAKFMMKMCIILHEHLTGMEAIERKYEGVKVH